MSLRTLRGRRCSRALPTTLSGCTIGRVPEGGALLRRCGRPLFVALARRRRGIRSGVADRSARKADALPFRARVPEIGLSTAAPSASASPRSNDARDHASDTRRADIPQREADAVDDLSLSGDRFLASGNEAGTPPEDRKFRPDVEGLRAVAVLLVVLYHARVPYMGGGYIGVDVFFVISGFVITGLLLRERASTGRTGLIAFYARRCRRILPAASVVIIGTVVASYHWLGFIRAAQIVADARSAALFVANFHFIALGTDYLTAQRPPSPLQHLWTLSVEEQFYVVYPTLFILIGLVGRRFGFRAKLATVLGVVVSVSCGWSIYQTSTNGIVAYFSPFTHAWELGLGGLIAIGSKRLSKLPRLFAAGATWLGLTAVVTAGLILSDATAYPGAAAALPVVGTAMVIGGGMALPSFGAELILRLKPMRWLGRLSYSFYLWHWPVLALAAEQAARPLAVGTNLMWVLVALAMSVVTYHLVENPIRHSHVLAKHRLLTVALAVVLTAVVLGVTTFELRTHS
jgi:peptidoglycan/LPS O-acetylase OafA/YrhL